MKLTPRLLRDIAWVAFSWFPRQVLTVPRWRAIALGCVAAAAAAVVAAGALGTATGGSAAMNPPAPPAPVGEGTPQVRAPAPKPLLDQEALRAALDDYLAGHDGLHCSVSLRIADETFDYDADRHYDTASIVKVDVLAALLYQSQESGDPLSGTQKALAERMITRSDNDATTSLFGDIGGPDGLDEVNAELGLTDTETDWNWGLVRTTSADQVKLWQGVMYPGVLDEDSVAYVRALTGSVVESQDWGVSAAASGEDDVLLKNGWDTRSSLDGRWVINSVGMIETPGRDDLFIAILTENHDSHDDGVDVVEDIAAIIGDSL